MMWSIKPVDKMEELRKKGEKKFPAITTKPGSEEISLLFKALGDETRLKILTLLWFEDLCMCEIAAAMDIASSTLTHHLKIMQKGQIIESRREGKFTVYSLNKQELEPMLPFIMDGGEHV